jgi:hypothetical protein
LLGGGAGVLRLRGHLWRVRFPRLGLGGAPHREPTRDGQRHALLIRRPADSSAHSAHYRIFDICADCEAHGAAHDSAAHDGAAHDSKAHDSANDGQADCEAHGAAHDSAAHDGAAHDSKAHDSANDGQADHAYREAHFAANAANDAQADGQADHAYREAHFAANAANDAQADQTHVSAHVQAHDPEAHDS